MRISLVALMIGIITLAAGQSVQADIVLSAIGIATVEDFDDFRGDGFSNAPSATQLDSNTYRATGLSDGDGAFGGVHDTGDFARGSSTGGVVSGGIYAFDVGGGNFGVGVQSTGSDFTPGTFTIRIANNTGGDIDGIDLEADGFFFNDAERSTQWIFEFSLDDNTYTPFETLDSPEASDDTPAWELDATTGNLPLPVISDGAQFFLRIRGDDLAGSGSRDEFALARLSITATSSVPEPTGVGLLAALGCLFVVRRQRKN